jgi:hypothetical protein
MVDLYFETGLCHSRLFFTHCHMRSRRSDRGRNFHFHLDGSSLAKLYSLGSIGLVSATFVEPWRRP